MTQVLASYYLLLPVRDEAAVSLGALDHSRATALERPLGCPSLPEHGCSPSCSPIWWIDNV